MNLMESLINVQNLTFFLLSNFDLTTLWTKSIFYSDIIRILYELNKRNQTQIKDNLYNQIIFYNKFLKQADGKCIFDAEFMHSGIWKVNDLFDQNQNLIPFEVLKQRGISNCKYMLWRSLIENLKPSMLNKTIRLNKSNDLTISFPSGDDIVINSATSKEIYRKIVVQYAELPPAVTKFIEIFPEFQSTMSERMYLLPHKCVKNYKLTDFQFQILHRFLPTNDLLNKMGKINSASCTFCSLYPETLTHIFYDCTCVKTIWMYVESVLCQLESETIKLRSQDILLGFALERDNCFSYKDVNNFLLYTKYFIWNCRKHNKDIEITGFKHWLIETYRYDNSLQKFVALLNY
jgi:hypothetical protein